MTAAPVAIVARAAAPSIQRWHAVATRAKATGPRRRRSVHDEGKARVAQPHVGRMQGSEGRSEPIATMDARARQIGTEAQWISRRGPATSGSTAASGAGSTPGCSEDGERGCPEPTVRKSPRRTRASPSGPRARPR